MALGPFLLPLSIFQQIVSFWINIGVKFVDEVNRKMLWFKISLWGVDWILRKQGSVKPNWTFSRWPVTFKNEAIEDIFSQLQLGLIIGEIIYCSHVMVICQGPMHQYDESCIRYGWIRETLYYW